MKDTWSKTFSIFLGLLLFVAVSANSLQPLQEPENNLIDTQQEKALAKKFMLAVKSRYQIISDPIINDYINTLGQRLASFSPSPTRHFHFFIIQNDGINAFSGPDGYIGIFSGLLLKSASESELASVLAHEIAHTTQHHIMRAINKQKTLQLSTLGAMLAAVLVGTQNQKAGAGIAQTAMASGYQSLLNFSREFEEEADRIGINILTRAGFNPNGMITFMNRLVEGNPTNPLEEIELLQSHPLIINRLADLSYRENNSANIITDSNFLLIKARLQARTALTPLGKCTEKSSNADCYLYALSLLKTNKARQANHVIDILIKKDPNQILFQISKADIEHALNHDTTALSILKNQCRYNPDYYPVILQYANLLLINNQSKKALSILAGSQTSLDHNAQYLYLLSKAQGESGHKAEGYYSRAKIYLLYEDKKNARQQLNMAIKFADNQFFKQQLKAKLKEISG